MGRSFSTDAKDPSFLRLPVAACSTPRETFSSPATPSNPRFVPLPHRRRCALVYCEPFRPSMSSVCCTHSGRRTRISKIELFEGPREELEKRLEQKKLDVCLTSLNDAPDSETSVALFC